MVFPLSKLIFIYRPFVYLGGISSFQTYIYLPTICLPRWYFLYTNLNSFTDLLSFSVVFPLSKTNNHLPKICLHLWYFLYPNLYSFSNHLSTLVVFPLSKLIFIYQPLVSLDGISSFQTYIYLPTICLPRWYFLCPNLYSFTQQSSTSVVFPLSKNIFIYRPLSPFMVVPLFKLILIYRPLPPSMVFPVSKLIFIYQPLIYLDGISCIQKYIHLPTTVSLDGSSSTQTYINLPTTYLPRWYFMYPNLYYFTNHLCTSMVFPLSKNIFIYRPLSPLMVVPLPKLILIYQPLIYLDGISCIQTYIILPTTCVPRWYFLYPKIYSFTDHCLP